MFSASIFFNIILFYVEEGLDAEGRFLLPDENDDFQCNDFNFTGLKAMNGTRWNSVSKMSESQLKYQGLCNSNA